MWKQLLLGSALLAGGLGTNETGYAHGGTYIGPGDTLPPGGGGGGGDGGPSTPGPTGPASPGPSGPSGPAGPATGGSSPAGPGATGPSSSGVTVGVSLASWDFWWAFNKEPYLNLRSKVQSGAELTGSDDFFLGRGQSARAKDTLRPSEQTIRGQVVPALKSILATERQNDIVTGALIALAKVGDIQEADGSSEFQEIIASFLRSGEQEISETAVLALGLLSDARVYPMLAALMKDTPEGRALVGKEVPVRTRAFAAYGLALIGRSVDDPDLLQRMAGDLIDVLERGHYARPDIQVGALTALGLLPLDWSADAGADDESAATDRVAVLEYLHKRMAVDNRGDAGFRDRRLSAQVPIAAGRLLSGDVPDSASGIRASIQKRLLGLASSPRAATEQRQGAIIALGMIGNAEKTDANTAILEGLTTISNSAADNQSRFLALMSLAQVGSRPGGGESPRALQDPAQRVLLKALARGKGQKKPWAALSLGVFGHALLSSEGKLDPTVLRALRTEAAKSVRPDEVGAYAIALGLMSDGESETILRDRLDVFAQDEPRGHIAVALGLMQAKGAAEELNAIVERSKFRPELLRQVAVGLGLLGDKSTVKGLINMLRTARGLSAQAAVAQGLGTIGDARSVKPLIGMLDDEGLTDTARGFAAVALGIVCDKDDLPWKTPFSVNVHYRANIPTLTSPGGTGILDIL